MRMWWCIIFFSVMTGICTGFAKVCFVKQLTHRSLTYFSGFTSLSPHFDLMPSILAPSYSPVSTHFLL